MTASAEQPPNERLKKFRAPHSAWCDCPECNHTKPTPDALEEERRYLNGV